MNNCGHVRIVNPTAGPLRIERHLMWGFGDNGLDRSFVFGTEAFGRPTHLPPDTDFDAHFLSMETNHKDQLYQDDLKIIAETARIICQSYHREYQKTGSIRPQLHTANISLTSFTNPCLADDILKIFRPYGCNIIAIEITEDRTGMSANEYKTIKENAQKLKKRGCILLLDDLSPHDPRLAHLAHTVDGIKTDHKLTQSILRQGVSVFAPAEQNFLGRMCHQGGIFVPEGVDTESCAEKLRIEFEGAQMYFQGFGISTERRVQPRVSSAANQSKFAPLNAAP